MAPLIKLRNFRGEIPKLGPTYLPDGFSTLCENAQIRSGELNPFYGPVEIATAVNGLGRSFAYFGVDGGWRTMGQRGRAIKSPTADGRYYYVSQTNPIRVAKWGTGAYDYPLILVAPTGAPTVSITAGTPDPDTKEELVFAYTNVTSLGEESQPSPLSARINWSPGVTIRVNAFTAFPSGRGVVSRRIYRSVTDYAGIATLHFIGETAATSFDYSNQTIAEPIPSIEWTPPHTDLMGITQMPNGIVAGHVGKSLFFCEPYILHAWPSIYELKTDSFIQGLAAFGSSLAVMTSGQPYVVQGTHPSNMVMTKIEAYYPCTHPNSIVDMGYFAAYASTDGIVAIDNSGARLLTGHLWTPEQFINTFPDAICAGRHDSRYVFHSVNLAAENSDINIIDTSGENPEVIRTTMTGRAYGINWFYNEPEDANLYYLRGTNGDRIYQFHPYFSGTRLTYRWVSKRIQTGQLVNFPWARCDADTTGGFGATVKIYGGLTNDLIHEFTTLNEPVRLPAGRLDDSFTFEITGKAKVFSVSFGDDPYSLGA